MKRTTACLPLYLSISFLPGCFSADAADAGITIGGVTYSGSTEAVAIDSTNRAQVSSFAASTTKGQVVATATGGIYKPEAAPATEMLFSRVTRALSLPRKAIDSRKAAGLAGGVLDSWTDICLDGGSVSYTTNYLDPTSLEYSAGDWESVTYEHCSAYGMTLHGRAVSTVTAASYSGDGWSTGVEYTLSALSIASDGRTTTVGGVFAEQHTETADSETETFTGDNLAVQIVDDAGVLLDEMVFTDFRFRRMRRADGLSAYAADYIVSAVGLGGRISVETTADFTIAAVGDYPATGQLVVIGDGDSRLRLTAQPDMTHFFIEYALTGGVYVGSETKTWSSLETGP